MPPLTRTVLQWFVLLLGLLAVVSSWFSIRPAVEHQYREMLALEEAHPGSISPQEWIDNEMNGLPQVIGLFLFGVPAFVIVSCCVAGIAAFHGQRKRVWLLLGLAWILLGGLLHLLIWKP